MLELCNEMRKPDSSSLHVNCITAEANLEKSDDGTLHLQIRKDLTPEDYTAPPVVVMDHMLQVALQRAADVHFLPMTVNRLHGYHNGVYVSSVIIQLPIQADPTYAHLAH